MSTALDARVHTEITEHVQSMYSCEAEQESPLPCSGACSTHMTGQSVVDLQLQESETDSLSLQHMCHAALKSCWQPYSWLLRCIATLAYCSLACCLVRNELMMPGITSYRGAELPHNDKGIQLLVVHDNPHAAVRVHNIPPPLLACSRTPHV